MSKQLPIPPANRSHKGPREPDHAADRDKPASGQQRPANADAQGQTGNTTIDTTHQGHQQDR